MRSGTLCWKLHIRWFRHTLRKTVTTPTEDRDGTRNSERNWNEKIVSNAGELDNQDDSRKGHLHGRFQKCSAPHDGEAHQGSCRPSVIPKAAKNDPQQPTDAQARCQQTSNCTCTQSSHNDCQPQQQERCCKPKTNIVFKSRLGQTFSVAEQLRKAEYEQTDCWKDHTAPGKQMPIFGGTCPG